MASSEPDGLLAGVRVLSFGAFVAGNSAACMLAALGADVVKVEARSRPEVLRTPAYAIGEAVTEPSGAPNTVMYATLTRGLRNLSLDMTQPAARALFHRLVSVTDVVVENFGGSVLDRWGCGYQELLRDKPDLVMLSLSGYGRQGPRANYLAYAATMASYIGLASSWGYTHGTLTDYVSAAAGALATVAALMDARERGTPRYIDLAQIDAMAPVLAELYAGPLNGIEVEAWQANRVPGSWLSGIYQCAGIDQWLAVDIEDGSDWNLLCELLDRPELRADDEQQARGLEPQLSDAVAGWAAGYSSYGGMHHLQRAGLAAAAVQDAEAVYRDLQLRFRGFAERVDQADLGPVLYSSSPQKWTTTPGVARVPPARLGEHTRDVLGRWLDLGDAEMDRLEAEGAIFSADSTPIRRTPEG
jgi:crotonobetainyl-CoA:carnitine CoA-transferase CaiB-like acyl-CoA transferase